MNTAIYCLWPISKIKYRCISLYYCHLLATKLSTCIIDVLYIQELMCHHKHCGFVTSYIIMVQHCQELVLLSQSRITFTVMMYLVYIVEIKILSTLSVKRAYFHAIMWFCSIAQLPTDVCSLITFKHHICICCPGITWSDYVSSIYTICKLTG